MSFHKLEGFIHDDAYIEYETDVMDFSFSKKENQFSFEWKERWAYVRPKTIYIPSERNIVATIPNWFDVKLEDNNIRSYMSDWEEARNYYAGKRIKVLDLGVEYAFEKTGRHDIVWLDNNNSIDFTNASSGLQSIIPLLVILQYVTDGVYEAKKESVFMESVNKQLLNLIHESLMNSNDNLLFSNENPFITKIGNFNYIFDKKIFQRTFID